MDELKLLLKNINDRIARLESWNPDWDTIPIRISEMKIVAARIEKLMEGTINDSGTWFTSLPGHSFEPSVFNGDVNSTGCIHCWCGVSHIIHKGSPEWKDEYEHG